MDNIWSKSPAIQVMLCIYKGAIMHGLQGAEAQGSTLEKGPLAADK